MTFPSLGIIGCGNMAAAILQNALSTRLLPAQAVTVSDRDCSKAEDFAKRFGTCVAPANIDTVTASELILFAVKPQDAATVLASLAPAFAKTRKIALSIIAGLSLERMEALLGKTTPIVRVMPNTPIQTGEGASVYTTNAACTAAEAAQVAALFQSGGICLSAPENYFDAVTALSGSGPAYVFLFMEALADAARSIGLPDSLGIPLVLQTLKGAVKLVEESGEPPNVLREKVTSKGGTTAAALAVLEKNNLRDLIKHAIQAASERSKELSRGIE